jgi:hypothetical protein
MSEYRGISTTTRLVDRSYSWINLGISALMKWWREVAAMQESMKFVRRASGQSGRSSGRCCPDSAALVQMDADDVSLGGA